MPFFKFSSFLRFTKFYSKPYLRYSELIYFSILPKLSTNLVLILTPFFKFLGFPNFTKSYKVPCPQIILADIYTISHNNYLQLTILPLLLNYRFSPDWTIFFIKIHKMKDPISNKIIKCHSRATKGKNEYDKNRLLHFLKLLNQLLKID
jgi:hypothetical protein